MFKLKKFVNVHNASDYYKEHYINFILRTKQTKLIVTY